MFQKSHNNVRLFCLKYFSYLCDMEKESNYGMTSEKGKIIQKEYSEIKEKEVCEERGLTQIGGSKTKIDGSNGVSNESIKNFTGSSTQVHLTTQKHFIKVLGLDDDSINFIKMFCGNELLNVKGRDRYFIPEINTKYVDGFLKFLNNNKVKVIDLIICNGFNITSVVYRDLKTGKIYDVEYQEIINKVNECDWVTKNGGIHLKNKNGKTYFHLQREGKTNKSNRYNVLWHIHRNLFLID